MKKVACKDCIHYRRAPYEALRTGCWHPDHMLSSQKERFLDQQQIPGNAEKINLRGDCASFEAKPTRPGIVQRILKLGI